MRIYVLESIRGVDDHTIVGAFATLEIAKRAAEDHAAEQAEAFSDSEGWDDSPGWGHEASRRYLHDDYTSDFYVIYELDVEIGPPGCDPGPLGDQGPAGDTGDRETES